MMERSRTRTSKQNSRFRGLPRTATHRIFKKHSHIHFVGSFVRFLRFVALRRLHAEGNKQQKPNSPFIPLCKRGKEGDFIAFWLDACG
jgi:hypothetical protein